MNLRPETKARVEASGLRLLNRVDLPPGRYQLRFAARDSAGGALGSVLYDLEVPDFAQAAVLHERPRADLAQRGGAADGAPRRAAQADSARPARGRMRTFPENDELMLFTEVYDNEGSSPHKVDIATTVTSDIGKVVFKDESERASSELGGERGGYGHTERIPLKDLGPGVYVLKVEARSRLGKGDTASREVQFTVGPAAAGRAALNAG